MKANKKSEKLEKLAKAVEDLGFKVYRWESDPNNFFINAENADGAADYYGDYINPKIEKVVSKAGGWVDWNDPGTLIVSL